jgi:hypothetical protein
MPIKAKCHLTDMGPEKYKKAIERLMTPGVPAATVAKEISKEFPGVTLLRLAATLARTRRALNAEAIRIKLVQEHSKNRESRLKDIHHSSMQVLSRLINVADLQMARVERWYAEELKQSRPFPGLSGLINEYCDTLTKVQKLQFDLGINEFKGPLSGIRGVIDKRTLPDGTHQQRHVYESIARVEEILARYTNGALGTDPAESDNRFN